MENIGHKLLKSLNDFNSLQEDHLNLLNKKKDINLTRQNFDRSQAFENLKLELADFFKELNNNKNKNLDLMLACKNRIEEILQKTWVLKSAIEDYKENICQELNLLQSSKKAVLVYASNR